MCLAVPAKIISCLSEEKAMVDMGGIQKEISIKLLDNLKIGDYVLVHAGFALTKINEKEALETLKILGDLSI